MEFFYAEKNEGELWYLDDVESRHLSKVLRKSAGSSVNLTNGKGLNIEGEVIEPGKQVIVKERYRQQIEDPNTLVIAVSPTKSADRMEWMVEKLIEIGIREIVFIKTQFSELSKMQARRIHLKAIAAMKQSQRLFLPKISYDISFADLLEDHKKKHNYLAHCYSDMGAKFAPWNNATEFVVKKKDQALIAIGPEGDFSRKEVELAAENGFQMLDLGESRLRTETAAIVACTLFGQ